MDDRNDEPHPAATSTTPLISAGTRLPPAQQAYSDYSAHAIRCGDCRDPDRGCETAGDLWRTYRQTADAALDTIRCQTPGR
ncbi:hypothetical protein [Streptomyces sp. NPDC101249]|uniref:hypothetical protein n=1 Tax=Streptomyces sp. NPDC101249 TaxID=3366140 RepID=UPI003805248B